MNENRRWVWGWNFNHGIMSLDNWRNYVNPRILDRRDCFSLSYMEESLTSRTLYLTVVLKGT